MAILRGFPPSNTISPSVRIAEKDLSFIAPEQSFHRAGLVGFASKGPMNVPTLIQSVRQLHREFGYPHPDTGDPYLIYAAEQYLLVSNELYVVRVGDLEGVSDESASTASVDVPVAGGVIKVKGSETGPFTMTKIDYSTGSEILDGSDVIPTDRFFKWKINGILSSKTLVVPGTNAQIDSSNYGTADYTCDELVAELNAQLDRTFDGIIFSNEGEKLVIETTFAYGPDATLELVAVQDALYGPYSIVGIGTGMTQAAVTNLAAKYPNDAYHSNGTYDFSSFDDDLTLTVVVDGTDNVLIDNVPQVITITAASHTDNNIKSTVDALLAAGTIPGGFHVAADSPTSGKLTFTTDHAGIGARIVVKTSSAGTLLGFDGTTEIGESPAGVTGDVDIADMAVVVGTSASVNNSFVINADSTGIEGNATKVVITNDLRENVFKMEVYNNDVQVESWGNLTKNEDSRYYVGTFLSLVSDYIIIDDNTDEPAPPKDGTYVLTGGADGIPSDPDKQDDLLIGSDVGYTGMFALSEAEQIDIDLIAVPGHPSTTVVRAMLDLCQNYRQDCLAIVDPPFGLTVKEITNWQNGVHPLNTERFDSDFGALYWPWVKIRDTFNNVDVWVPPSGSVMATYARSDSMSAPWFAVAGLTRGIVPGISDVFNRPTQEERDLMYGLRNAVNPIIQFPDIGGFVIWGQKTLQRLPTAMDRVNVRRLMFAAEKRIRAASRGLLFDPHDEIFRSRFVKIASRILDDIKVGRGLHNYIILADESINTADVVDRNEFRARIGIQPTRAVEFIFIEFSVHRTNDFGSSADNF